MHAFVTHAEDVAIAGARARCAGATARGAAATAASDDHGNLKRTEAPNVRTRRMSERARPAIASLIIIVVINLGRIRRRASMASHASSAAYVSGGTVRARAPFSPIGTAWACVDVVVAFVRTMLEPGYAEVYASRATTTRTTTVVAPGRVRTNAGGGGSASVRGYSNVRTIDHSAPAVGG